MLATEAVPMTNAIVHVPCTTAEELMNGLGRKNPLWAGHRHFWAFRGHKNDDFKLVPSALRAVPPAQLGYTSDPKVGIQKSNREQVLAEFARVHEFYWAADAQGLQIAGNNDLLRTPNGWRTLKNEMNKEGWPIDDLLPLLALAQHYNVATRLLDWTDKALVAAYFASKDAAKESMAQKPAWSHLGIWALNLDWVIRKGFPGDLRKISVYVITAPRASNPNLHAQGGVFTTDHIVRSEFDRAVVARSVDQVVERQWKKLKHVDPVMVHFSLPLSESRTLLRVLNQEGVNAATVFPGYQGVADALSERFFWDTPDRSSYWVKP